MRLTPRKSRETGREYALRTIKDNIVRLELAPGSFISENELAAEMGLSRTPVREALIDLAKVKIIEITPQKRSVVAYIDYDMVEEARFMRNTLECAVVELACQSAMTSEILPLEDNVRLQRFHLEHGNYGEIMELDNQFHELLFQIAQKSQVYAMIQHISIQFDRVRSIALNQGLRMGPEGHHTGFRLVLKGQAVAGQQQLGMSNMYPVKKAQGIDDFPHKLLLQKCRMQNAKCRIGEALMKSANADSVRF